MSWCDWGIFGDLKKDTNKKWHSRETRFSQTDALPSSYPANFSYSLSPICRHNNNKSLQRVRQGELCLVNPAHVLLPHFWRSWPPKPRFSWLASQMMSRRCRVIPKQGRADPTSLTRRIKVLAAKLVLIGKHNLCSFNSVSSFWNPTTYGEENSVRPYRSWAQCAARPLKSWEVLRDV